MKKIKNEIFEKCHSAEKRKRGDPLGFFVIHCVAKIEERLFFGIQKVSKKSRIVPKKDPSEKHQREILCYRGSGRRCFCFGRGSVVSSMFWRSVVIVDDVEQMNKKVDRLR